MVNKKTLKLLKELPDTIVFGGHPFKLIVSPTPLTTDANKFVQGWFNPGGADLSISMPYALQRGPTHAVETLFHEVLHGAHWMQGLEETMTEEEVVAPVAQAMVTIFSQNPWLLPWLNKGMK